MCHVSFPLPYPLPRALPFCPFLSLLLSTILFSAFVSLESSFNDLHVQVAIISTADVAIGLHGSILVLSLFLPPGAMLIELFPYAVPPENYTPFRTLVTLPGMRAVFVPSQFSGLGLEYRFWVNKNECDSVAHPERDAEEGGIAHLPEEMQRKVLFSHCCFMNHLLRNCHGYVLRTDPRGHDGPGTRVLQ
jgi:hypothetical protein